MKNKNLGYWFILVAFVVTGIVSWRVYFKVYSQDDTISIHHFPRAIGNWVSEELTITDDEKAILETDNVFVRRYTNTAGEEVFLFIVYSQNNRKVSHPPEICYTGGGATIIDSVSDSFTSATKDETVNVSRLTIERGRITQIFAYWFKVGDSFTSNYWKQQGLVALKALFGLPSSSALIRISATVKNGNRDVATNTIKKFGQQILPHIHQYLP